MKNGKWQSKTDKPKTYILECDDGFIKFITEADHIRITDTLRKCLAETGEVCAQLLNGKNQTIIDYIKSRGLFNVKTRCWEIHETQTDRLEKGNE